MDTSHLHRQKELDVALVNSLIEATPESWKAFRLTLVFEGVGAGKEGIRHEISSLEGKPEVVYATPEMFEASFRISDHFRGLGRPLASAIYEAKALPSGEWSWHGEWSYETL